MPRFQISQHNKWEQLQKNGRSRYLIVLLHAYTMAPQNLQSVCDAVREVLPDADQYVPKLPVGLFSFSDPDEIAVRLIDRVSEIWNERAFKSNNGQGYDHIILIGHSLGALLARKMYVYSCGEKKRAPFERRVPQSTPWSSKVERIILLAGTNRGWSISHHMSAFRAVTWSIGNFIGNLLTFIFGKQPLIFHFRRGAPFITNLRLQWLAMRQAAKNDGSGNALTIQLLGTVDDMVGPEDNLDLVTGKDFRYLEIPSSGHANVIKMDGSKAGKSRKKVFVYALTSKQAELQQKEIVPVDQQDLPMSRPEVTDVIFVIHGIRDLGYWTSKIAWKVKEKGKAIDRVFETETSTYGYFPMLSFLLPWQRRKKVEWLMDQYVEDRSLFPNAEFSFIGHSNGTYLLAKALKEYPCCYFKHIIFAGSVVRTDYDWSSALQSGRVQAILNYVATRDLVVAVFPKALQLINWQDLGSAGHDGFSFRALDYPAFQVKYVYGGHAAALKEENWEALANFIVNGQYEDPPNELQRSKNSAWVVLIGKIAPLWWTMIAAILFFVAWNLCKAPWPEWLRTAALILYIFGVTKILTKL